MNLTKKQVRVAIGAIYTANEAWRECIRVTSETQGMGEIQQRRIMELFRDQIMDATDLLTELEDAEAADGRG